jgi:WD40 repeat protein
MASPRPSSVSLTPLPTFKPDLYQRAWSSIPHPTLPLIATTHAKAVTIFSLSTLTKHSSLSGGHTRSVRCAAWKPGLPPGKLCLVTGSFDATAGLWRWEREGVNGDKDEDQEEGGNLEVDVTSAAARSNQSQGRRTSASDHDQNPDPDSDGDDWEFTLVLEGHENEIKSVSFSPSGQYLATCSRDKTVWIWEDVGASESDDEWETVAVLSEHDGDIKAVAWCPDVPGRNAAGKGKYGSDVLASASYDNTVRIWREDGDGEWVCVAVLEGHEETVWGLQWEPKPDNERFPRLMTFSADATIRIWTLQVEEEEEEAPEVQDGAAASSSPFFRSGMSGIPNTMRRGLREDWTCTAVLPRTHTRDIYSASWSGASGMIASTGSDGVIAVYGEEQEQAATETTVSADKRERTRPSNHWHHLGTIANGHGPYEINHITWCKRFDSGAEQRGVEEMLVTTGDDGIVRPWQIASV